MIGILIGMAMSVVAGLLKEPTIESALLKSIEDLFKAIAQLIQKHHPNPLLQTIATDTISLVNQIQAPPQPDVGFTVGISDVKEG